MLTSMGCDTVIVTGCSTSACVRSTVDDASAHGYHTIVPETCVGDRSDEQHKAHLWDLDKKFANVEPVDAVESYLANLRQPSRRSAMRSSDDAVLFERLDFRRRVAELREDRFGVFPEVRHRIPANVK